MEQHLYDISRKTFLCVDEDIDTRWKLDRIFARHYSKHKYLSARNGIEALMCIKDCNPDIFIVDLNMHIFDWVLLSEEILRLERASETIGMAADFNGVTADRCLKAGIKNYVTKPINFDILFVKVDKIMEAIFVKRLNLSKANTSKPVKLTILK